MAEAIRDDEQIPKEGLEITYYLSDSNHLSLQKEVYQLYNPSLEGFVDREVFDVDIFGVNFRFYKAKNFS